MYVLDDERRPELEADYLKFALELVKSVHIFTCTKPSWVSSKLSDGFPSLPGVWPHLAVNISAVDIAPLNDQRTCVTVI
jgi:hypothetical protein